MRAKEFFTEYQIPSKSVVQGYTVEYNPAQRLITISRQGQVLGTTRINIPNERAFIRAVNKFIERIEDERYPTDLEVREGSVFGQQDFDTQMALATMQNKLAKQRPAQSAPAEPASNQPQSMADMQRQHAELAPIVRAKQEIEAIKSKLTRGGRPLPPGLAADVEDYYTLDDVKKYPQEVLAKYQRQLSALQKYASLKQAVWRR
jgi:hypothetical protein